MSDKMSKCKSCGNDLASSAKSCPNCGAKNKKPIFKKWWFWLIVVIVLIGVIGASGGGEDTGTETTVAPSVGNSISQAVVETEAIKDNQLGSYQVEIKNARLTKNYEGKPVVVITYGFTNNSSEPQAFWLTIDDTVYQNGVGLEKAYVLDDNDPYDEANQNKEIKSGVTLDVDVAYILNDTETDIEVEAKEIVSFTNDVVTRTFSLK